MEFDDLQIGQTLYFIDRDGQIYIAFITNLEPDELPKSHCYYMPAFDIAKKSIFVYSEFFISSAEYDETEWHLVKNYEQINKADFGIKKYIIQSFMSKKFKD